MWKFARMQDPDAEESSLDSALGRLIGRGMFEPLEPPTAKRDRPMYLDDEIVAQAEAEALAL